MHLLPQELSVGHVWRPLEKRPKKNELDGKAHRAAIVQDVLSIAICFPSRCFHFEHRGNRSFQIRARRHRCRLLFWNFAKARRAACSYSTATNTRGSSETSLSSHASPSRGRTGPRSFAAC